MLRTNIKTHTRLERSQKTGGGREPSFLLLSDILIETDSLDWKMERSALAAGRGLHQMETSPAYCCWGLQRAGFCRLPAARQRWVTSEGMAVGQQSEELVFPLLGCPLPTCEPSGVPVRIQRPLALSQAPTVPFKGDLISGAQPLTSLCFPGPAQTGVICFSLLSSTAAATEAPLRARWKGS